jgi:mono/diheme cytochrome c family protein
MRTLTLLLVLVLSACGAPQKRAAPSSTAHAEGAADPLANGRAIYMTGRDLAGRQITASPPPLRTSCMQCHRADGSGGVHFPGIDSADLRHKELVTEQKHPYTIALLERAISTGVDNEGQRLNPVMPRWRMSKSDLHDVAEYVYRRLK